MNNEIKETFDMQELFKEWKQFLSWCYENNDKTVEIHRDKLKYTMDYITNLEKKYENAVADYEMEKAKNNIIVKLGDEYKSTIDDLQKHCLNQKTKITNLEQENKQYKEYVKELKESLMNYHIKNNKLIENAIHNDKVVDKARWNEMLYKSRIDKAIEYIKEKTTNEYTGEELGYSDNIDYEHLLNILTGGDE